MLLLGFGDVRNALATAAGCAAASGARGGPSRLAFDLCDNSPLNAARGALLLHLVGGVHESGAQVEVLWREWGGPLLAALPSVRPLACNQAARACSLLLAVQASTLDPSSEDDLDFLWGVSYCLRLSAAHSERLAAAVRALLSPGGGLGGYAGYAEQAAALQRVMRGWLEGAPRGVAEVERERQLLLLARMSTKLGRRISTAAELLEVHRWQAIGALQNLLPSPRRGVGVGAASMPGMNQASVLGGADA